MKELKLYTEEEISILMQALSYYMYSNYSGALRFCGFNCTYMVQL